MVETMRRGALDLDLNGIPGDKRCRRATEVGSYFQCIVACRVERNLACLYGQYLNGVEWDIEIRREEKEVICRVVDGRGVKDSFDGVCVGAVVAA